MIPATVLRTRNIAQNIFRCITRNFLVTKQRKTFYSSADRLTKSQLNLRLSAASFFGSIGP